MDHHTVETCYCGQINQYFRYFLEEWTPCAPDQRRKGSSRLLPATSPKARVCHGMGLCQCLGKGNLHFCDGTINAEKYIEILEHNMLPSRRHLFQGRPCIFNKTMQNHILHTLQSPGCGGRGYGVLDWPACSPDLSPIENVWRILKRKMRQRRPRTVAHLKTCLQEEWDKITPETLHHLVSSVPKRILSVVKRKWQHYKVVNALLSQLFLECVAGLNDRKGCYIYK